MSIVDRYPGTYDRAVSLVFDAQPASWPESDPRSKRIAEDIASRVIELIDREMEWLRRGQHPTLTAPKDQRVTL